MNERIRIAAQALRRISPIAVTGAMLLSLAFGQFIFEDESVPVRGSAPNAPALNSRRLSLCHSPCFRCRLFHLHGARKYMDFSGTIRRRVQTEFRPEKSMYFRAPWR